MLMHDKRRLLSRSYHIVYEIILENDVLPGSGVINASAYLNIFFITLLNVMNTLSKYVNVCVTTQ